ncbi:hypothetical protein FSS13T_08510 [Flavobacterium saliperosum S13]|uniref:histidine kinase n=1 Tax=Flavobacterium saliperosum S13 TaxID=1341155 RepID=A0ABN0QIP1_9FLAO|nr:hypothetical protein FSS13T_08510 [Flavobacterium saliperosum S13]
MLSLKNILCCILFFQLHIGNGQTADKIKAAYQTKNAIEKIDFYEKLNLNQKRAYRDFFWQHFPKLASEEQIKSDKKTQIRYKFALAEVYNIKEDELKSIEVLKEIQNDKDYRLSDSENMNVLVGLQKSYLNLNLYSTVFKINSEIAQLRKKGASFPLWSYNIKSNLYARLFLYDKAIPQLKSEIADLLKNPERDSLIVPSAYNDLGFYYAMNNRIDSAYQYYNIALRKAEKALKSTDFETYERLSGVVKGNIAVLKIRQNDYKNAVSLLEEDAAIGIKNNDNNSGTIKSLILLTECNIHLKNYDEAQNNINQIEQLLSKGISPETKVGYYKAKAELLKFQNKKDEAYANYEKAFRLSDSINSVKQRLLLAGNDILYQLEQKDNVIEKQQSDIDTKEKGILYIVAIALVVILMTTLFYLRNSRKKRKEIEQKNNLISAKNETIKESLAEKEMLLKEIHHRVKNNLQIISGILELQNFNITDENAKIILKEGQARIQSIALIHKTLYQSENFSKVPFQNYLTELVQAIQDTYRNAQMKIETVINANDIELSINTAIPLSLIINEIITNCYKHAFIGRNNGTINIHLTKEDTTYKLVIQDNGNGLPDDFNPKKLHSVGFDLIQGLSKQLEGTFDWKTENGTAITITFKDNIQ